VSAPLTLAIILAVAIPLQLWRAYRVAPGGVERWALDHGLDLTAENRPLVASYLRHARVWRTWGAVAGLLLPSVIEFAWSGRVQVLGFGTDGEMSPLAFGTLFVGYLVGALCGEVSFARPVLGARRRASLVPRELTDYVPRRAVLAQRALAALCAVGLLAMALVPYDDSLSLPSTVSLAIAAAVVVAFAAALEAIERWLVRRAQPFSDPALVAADDAVRARSIRAVAGAGLALLAVLCCGVSLGLQGSELDALQVVMVVPAAGFFVLSLLVCGDLGEGRWRVARSSRTAGPASA
jgi:hypothetical protein